MKSPKEISINKKLLDLLCSEEEPELYEAPRKAIELLIADPEIEALQEYANSVSIVRLGYNDHGPVHMRTVTYNAIQMLKLLRRAGAKTSLETENAGGFEDSLTAVILAAFLHDTGMSIGRQDHELFSVTLSAPIIERVLARLFPGNSERDFNRRVIVRSVALEGIAGHMGTRKVHSLEAGVILIADGCDMTKGRARIPMALNSEPKVGDIHKYSANSIERVNISSGEQKPIRIDITMSSSVGFFQIEEILLQKIECSSVKPYIELIAGVSGEEAKQYL